MPAVGISTPPRRAALNGSTAKAAFIYLNVGFCTARLYGTGIARASMSEMSGKIQLSHDFYG